MRRRCWAGERDRGELREHGTLVAGIREPLCVGGRRRISIPDLVSIVTAAGSEYLRSHFQFKSGDPEAAQLRNVAQLDITFRRRE